MSKIVVTNKGDFSKLDRFFNNISTSIQKIQLDRYGKMGVKALQEATPKDSGITADSWYYVIEHDEVNKTLTVAWYNANVVDDWFNVAIMLQYGHATRNGGYVKGRDYINPALRPIFDKMARDAWKEVTNS